MAKARRSGIVVTTEMVPIILGMVQRGDRNHDISAWLGLNQGRIAEVKNGDYGNPAPAPEDELPPSGSPGPKALALRDAATRVRRLLRHDPSRVDEALDELTQAIAA